MPEGTSVIKMAQKHDKIVSYCLKTGYSFSPRLHIILFGNTRAT
jgi:hypothetical protein